MTEKEKALLESRIYKILKEHLLNEEEEHGVVKVGNTRIVPSDGKSLSKKTYSMVAKLIPILQGTNDKSVNSYSFTRSQIAYELWPDIDKDSARSKLSQKISGEKAWNEWELNKIANLVSSSAS